MEIRELSIPHSYEFTPRQHPDERGVFLEWYRFEGLASRLGRTLEVKQANLSVSRRGVVRGVHYTLVPPGQAKYVTVVAGRVLDFVVDVREGSPTFGSWDSVELDDVDRRAVYLPEGVGHAFVALSEQATVCYLASSVHDPRRELALDPFDADLAIEFPPGLALSTSARDSAAPTLAEARARGDLPVWVSS